MARWKEAVTNKHQFNVNCAYYNRIIAKHNHRVRLPKSTPNFSWLVSGICSKHRCPDRRHKHWLLSSVQKFPVTKFEHKVLVLNFEITMETAILDAGCVN